MSVLLWEMGSLEPSCTVLSLCFEIVENRPLVRKVADLCLFFETLGCFLGLVQNICGDFCLFGGGFNEVELFAGLIFVM